MQYSTSATFMALRFRAATTPRAVGLRFPYARLTPMGEGGDRAGAQTASTTVGRGAQKGVSAPLDAVMDRFARGEDEALAELYRLGAPRLRAFLARLCADLSLADDLTQDAFLRIHSARGTFVAGAPALPWMFAIARNSYLDHVRREHVRRDHRANTALALGSERLNESTTSGDRALIARQMLGLVQRTLVSLPVRQREAFVLMRFEGLSLVEAAEVLGATQAAVKILVHRAYVAVRAEMEKQNKADETRRKATR